MAGGALSLLGTYPDAWKVAGCSFLVTMLATAALYGLALRYRLLPGIRERDVHTVRKPRVGGAAMWLAASLTLLWLVADGWSGRLQFGQPGPGGIDTTVWGMLAGMGILLVMGLRDDLKGLPWYGQLAGQFLAALAVIVSGVDVPFVSLPFGLHVTFPAWLSVAFVTLWIMGMINVMNWFDGLDGLAGSMALIAAVSLYLLSLQVGLLGTATLSLIVIGMAAAFLIWNWYPSKLFMGTVGSQLLGFLLAVIAIISGGKLATIGLVVGIPVMDSLVVVFRRLRAGASPFQADQRHLHHRLLKIGLPVPWVVLLIDAIALAFGLLALYNPGPNAKGALLLILVGLMAAFILVTYALERRATKRVH